MACALSLDMTTTNPGKRIGLTTEQVTTLRTIARIHLQCKAATIPRLSVRS